MVTPSPNKNEPITLMWNWKKLNECKIWGGYQGNRSQFNSSYHVITNTGVKHQGRITVRGVRSMSLSRVRVKLSWLLKAVKCRSIVLLIVCNSSPDRFNSFVIWPGVKLRRSPPRKWYEEIKVVKKLLGNFLWKLQVNNFFSLGTLFSVA